MKNRKNMFLKIIKSQQRIFLLNEKDNISSEVLTETFDFIDNLEYDSQSAINSLSKLFEIKNLNSNN
jgi:hypothetical protein